MTIGTEAILKKNLIIASFDENLRKKNGSDLSVDPMKRVMLNEWVAGKLVKRITALLIAV